MPMGLSSWCSKRRRVIATILVRHRHTSRVTCCRVMKMTFDLIVLLGKFRHYVKLLIKLVGSMILTEVEGLLPRLLCNSLTELFATSQDHSLIGASLTRRCSRIYETTIPLRAVKKSSVLPAVVDYTTSAFMISINLTSMLYAKAVYLIPLSRTPASYQLDNQPEQFSRLHTCLCLPMTSTKHQQVDTPELLSALQ